MISIFSFTAAIYLLIMLFAQSVFISHSATSMKINIDKSYDYHALKVYSKSFSHENFRDFSLFHLVTQDGITSLWVVSNNDTIIAIDTDTMKSIYVYRPDFCQHLPKYQCEDSIKINAMSEISLFHQTMIWFCYIPRYIYLPYPITTQCIVPKNKVIPQDITWTKRGFSSIAHSDGTLIVQAHPYIFIGSIQQNSLTILRTKLPDYNGKIDSNDDLVTPMSEYYFAKNSHFLLAFERQYEVYYVVQEPISANSHSISECVTSSDTRSVVSTRLIKICKDDLGNFQQENERNFGTFAKADIVCPVGSETEPYYYTRSISASWSSEKLYVLFESQKNSPSGKVICVFDKFSIDTAFNSEIFSTFEKANHKLRKPIQDICKKLTENSLTVNETKESQSMSVDGLYRLKPIKPARTVPVMNLGNSKFHDIQTFTLHKLDPTTVIMLIDERFIRLVSHMDDNSICHIMDFRFDNNETINKVKSSEIKLKVFVHISTSKRIVQLELSMCERFPEKSSCLASAPTICGWDNRQKKCTMMTTEVDPIHWQRSSCRTNVNIDDSWSLPEKCLIKNNQEELSCVCRYCLHESGCLDGQRVDITDCKALETTEIFSKWSSWSMCFPGIKYQKRFRKCKVKTCIGPRVEHRKCPGISISVATTNWTKWYKTEDNLYSVSFRAQCPTNQMQTPVIQQRQRFCGESCLDSALRWSLWSDCTETNIQYRLLNCSSFDVCPYTRTEVKSCPLKSQKYKNPKDVNAGTYSVLHIVLATLIASLVWLVILISVSIFLFRYNYHYQKRSRSRSAKRNKYNIGGLSSSNFQPYFSIQQKSVLSETSNDYLSCDFPSPLYNPDQSTSSCSLTIDNDQSSKDRYSFI